MGVGEGPSDRGPAPTHGGDCFTETSPRGTLIHIGYGIAGNSESQDSGDIRIPSLNTLGFQRMDGANLTFETRRQLRGNTKLVGSVTCILGVI